MSDIFLGTPNANVNGIINTTKYVWGNGTNTVFLGPDGDLIMVSGTQKLQQDMVKILMTQRYVNSIYPVYGAVLRSLLGKKLDVNLMKAQVRQTVIEALAVLQNLNIDNPNPDEQIETIDTITVSSSSPTELDIAIQVTTKNGNTVNAITTIGG